MQVWVQSKNGSVDSVQSFFGGWVDQIRIHATWIRILTIKQVQRFRIRIPGPLICTICEPSQAKRWLRHNFWKFLFSCQSVYLSNFHQGNFGAHLQCVCAINKHTLRTCHSMPGINETKIIIMNTCPNSRKHGTPSGDKA